MHPNGERVVRRHPRNELRENKAVIAEYKEGILKQGIVEYCGREIVMHGPSQKKEISRQGNSEARP